MTSGLSLIQNLAILESHTYLYQQHYYYENSNSTILAKIIDIRTQFFTALSDTTPKSNQQAKQWTQLIYSFNTLLVWLQRSNPSLQSDLVGEFRYIAQMLSMQNVSTAKRKATEPIEEKNNAKKPRTSKTNSSSSLDVNHEGYMPQVIQKLEFGKAGAQNLSQAKAGAEEAPVLTQGRCRQAQSLECRHSQNQLSDHEGYIPQVIQKSDLTPHRFLCKYYVATDTIPSFSKKIGMSPLVFRQIIYGGAISVHSADLLASHFCAFDCRLDFLHIFDWFKGSNDLTVQQVELLHELQTHQMQFDKYHETFSSFLSKFFANSELTSFLDDTGFHKACIDQCEFAPDVVCQIARHFWLLDHSLLQENLYAWYYMNLEKK